MIQFHHTGILTKDIKSSIENFSGIFPENEVSQIYTISSQEVKVCFFNVPRQTRFEFVEPLSSTASVNTLFDKGVRYYHIGCFSDNLRSDIEEQEKKGYKLLSEFNSEAFGNRKCVYLISPNLEFLELIET